MKIGDRAQRNP